MAAKGAAESSERAVLCVTGSDRRGILDEVSQLLLQHGLNVVDSRAVMLGGQFALLVLLTGSEVASDESVAALRRQLQDALTAGGLEARLMRVGAAAIEDGAPMQLRVTGRDRAGVLHKISHLLRVLNVNIEGIEVRQGGGKTGAAAGDDFELSLLLRVPVQTPRAMLREYLEQLCKELGVKWLLTPHGGKPDAAAARSARTTKA